MGVFGKFKDLVGIEEIEDDEITEEEIQAAAAQLERKTVEPKSSFTASPSKSSSNDSKVQPIRTVTDKTGTFKLVVREPEGFDECPKLVDNLKSNKPVIINLEKVESGTARKIFDFLNGATYALNGNVQKIANNIFVFTPKNVDIAAQTEHKELDFTTSTKNMWR